MTYVGKVIYYCQQICLKFPCKKCIELYKLDPTYFLSASGLTWPACLKKKELELELVMDVDMLLAVEKGIKCGMFHGFHQYAKVNSLSLNIMTQTKNCHISRLGCKQLAWMGNVPKVAYG